VRTPLRGPSKTRFEKIFKEGKRSAGRLCRLTALPGTGYIGIATSKKIGNNPQRNRAKRRFREVLRELRERLNPCLDYVVIALPSSTEARLTEISAKLRSMIENVNERWAAESESS
jgi:ribonuclease P protein component